MSTCSLICPCSVYQQLAARNTVIMPVVLPGRRGPQPLLCASHTGLSMGMASSVPELCRHTIQDMHVWVGFVFLGFKFFFLHCKSNF